MYESYCINYESYKSNSLSFALHMFPRIIESLILFAVTDKTLSKQLKSDEKMLPFYWLSQTLKTNKTGGRDERTQSRARVRTCRYPTTSDTGKFRARVSIHLWPKVKMISIGSFLMVFIAIRFCFLSSFL